MNNPSITFTKLTEAIQAQAVASETYANLKLKELGIGFVFNNQGQTIYVIEDYPNRPTHDYFKDDLLVKPIGYTWRGKDKSPLYGLSTPYFITPPTNDIADIMPQLKILEDYTIKYRLDHGLDTPLNLLAPYFFIFKNDFKAIDECVIAGMHPKLVAELLAMNFNLSEIIASKDIPPQFLMKMGEVKNSPS